MKCPKCVKEGKKSQVYPGMQTTTLMGYQSYYDEDGAYHENNPNKVTRHLTCSNGHEWVETS